LTENSLDVEWSGAVAPGAQIVLVTSGVESATDDTVYDSSSYVVENAGVSSTPVANAHILSVSYGLCELGEGTGGNAAYNNLWETAATEGIAVFVASGDAGSATCDQVLDTTVPYAAQLGVSVSGLASTPYNTAVGGTDLNWGSTASPYWNTTNSSTTGASAKGYIPEVPWNDTCTNPLTLAFIQQTLVPALQKAGYTNVTSPTDAESSCEFVITWYKTVASTFNIDISGFVDVVGGGGGVSACTTSDGQTVASCTGGYAKPSWQTGVAGIPADGKRDLPDVSFFASNGFLGSAYLICVSANGACTYTATTEPTAQEVGGTSVASPAMAGVMALIDQKVGTPQGNPNAELYSLAAKQNYANCSAESVTVSGSCYFNDVDTGTNAMPCQPTTPNCNAVVHSGDTVSVLSGYGATAGFDAASGLGSLNVANVVNGWTAPATSTGTATVTVAPAATAITVAQPLSVTVNVSATTGTPTGTLTLTGPGFVGSVQTLATGPYTFNIPAGGLSGGTDTLTATYSGDTNFAEASGTATVTVSKLAPAITVTPSATSINSNAALTVTGTISGTGPTPTGTVTLAGGGYTSGTITLSSGSYTVTIPANSLTAGADTLTVSYSGDTDYAAITGTSTVTVTETVYAVSAAAAASVSPGGSTTSTVTISSATGYAGTVTVTCALTNSPAGASDLPGCAAKLGSATVTLSSTTATGAATVTVTTMAATTGALRLPGNGKGLAGAGSAVLAILVLFGIPARRRAWRAMLGVLALMAALGSLAACGGGGGSSGGGGTGNPGTTAGTYTFTVTGVGSPALTPAPTATFTVTVN